MVFWQSFGKQATFIWQNLFFWLAFFLAISGFQNWLQGFSKSFAKFGFGFFVRFLFSGKVNFSQSQFFSVGFRKFSALAFWLVSCIFQNKVGLVKNDGACKIKSQKGVVLSFGKRVLHNPHLPNKACT